VVVEADYDFRRAIRLRKQLIEILATESKSNCGHGSDRSYDRKILSYLAGTDSKRLFETKTKRVKLKNFPLPY
jgi:hypothetical protein